MECGNCIYYKDDRVYSGAGLCRRYPPKIIGALIVASNEKSHSEQCSVASFFPSTDASDFCGEFEPSQK